MTPRRTPRRMSTYRRREQARKAVYVLPNLFTTASMFVGFLSMIEAISGHYVLAAVAVLGSLVLDGLDGRVARATNTTSKFGVEYDSLADLVAFGVAPALLVYLWGLEPLGRLGLLAAFLFAACGALRLARFNVQVEEVGTSHFVGLPIPAAASMLCTTVLMWEGLWPGQPLSGWPLVLLCFLLAFLMVSNIPYLSLKEMRLGRMKSFNGVVAGVLLFVLVAIIPEIMGFAIMAGYVVLGPVGARLMARSKAAKKAELEARAAQDEEGEEAGAA